MRILKNFFVVVYTMGPDTGKTDHDNLSKLLSSVGLCYQVPESQINAYCGLFASGIGFVSFLSIFIISTSFLKNTTLNYTNFSLDVPYSGSHGRWWRQNGHSPRPQHPNRCPNHEGRSRAPVKQH